MEVRRPPSPIRCPFAQKASPSTTFPPCRHALLFISLSLAVELTLTRLPPRCAPPPPIPRALSSARSARFALPQPIPAPAASAQRRTFSPPPACAPWRLQPPRDPAIEPWSPAAAAHPGFELLWHALLQVLRTFARCRHRLGRPSLPPPFPFPLAYPAWCLPKIEFRKAPSHVFRRPAARLTAVRTPPARARAIRTRPRSRRAPHQAGRVGATWHPRTPFAGPGLSRSPGPREGSGWTGGLATRGAHPEACARWQVVQSARMVSRAIAAACVALLCGASALAWHVCAVHWL